MDEQTFRAIMKEWYWLVIFGSLVALAFTPSFLKAKCPRCKKRKMVNVAVDDTMRLNLENAQGREFLTFFRCDACSARLYRERTGPFEDATAAGLSEPFEYQEQNDAALVP